RLGIHRAPISAAPPATPIPRPPLPPGPPKGQPRSSGRARGPGGAAAGRPSCPDLVRSVPWFVSYRVVCVASRAPGTPAGDGRRAVVAPAGSQLSRCTGTKRVGRAGPGGAAGIRPPDLRRARAALSRLSYGPRTGPPARPVGAPGLEPGTSALSGPRSDRLSYA